MYRKQALPMAEQKPIRPRCHVPWQQMVIDSNGVVAPCCYWGAYGNDNPPMGNVNEQTIEEIWNSPRYQRLRKHMAAGDLRAAGCEKCYALKQGLQMALVNDPDADREAALPESQRTPYYRNLTTLRQEVAVGATVLKAKPTVISMTPSHRCNLRCTHCYQESTRTLDLKQERITSEMLSLYPTLVRLIAGGGEPFLLPIWRTFFRQFDCKQNPYLDFGTTTNATIVNNEVQQGLRKFKTLTINVSLDGTGAVFEQVRVGARFEEVRENIRKLKAIVAQSPSSRSTFGVSMCVMKSTVESLPSFVRFCTEEAIPFGLSPVMSEPPDESLACFNDPQRETAGWREAYDEARRLTREEYIPKLAAAFQTEDQMEALEMNYDLLKNATPWELLDRRHFRFRIELPDETVERNLDKVRSGEDLYVYIYPVTRSVYGVAQYYARLQDQSGSIHLPVWNQVDSCMVDEGEQSLSRSSRRGPFYFDVSLPAGRYFFGLSSKWENAGFFPEQCFSVVNENGEGRLVKELLKANKWKRKTLGFCNRLRASVKRRLSGLIRSA